LPLFAVVLVVVVVVAVVVVVYISRSCAALSASLRPVPLQQASSDRHYAV
jgi:hypothetical protein